MAGWVLLNQKQPGMELMQNCDLPPPSKVFSGSDKAVFITSMNRICSIMGAEEEYAGIHAGGDGHEKEKLALLKALRLSQTRAREAESKNNVLAKERDCLCNALLEESSKLVAYRHWVKLLELQVSKLQRERVCQKLSVEEEDDGEDEGGVKWMVAMALCLGIAGVGFAFGCRYLF